MVQPFYFVICEIKLNSIPFDVVVLLFGPFNGIAPYGNADLFIIVFVLPESISAIRSLSISVF